ncbi:hypothetical protein [uncultured Nostoc sp.]
MPSVTAFAKCPGLIFIRPRFDVYREISACNPRYLQTLY